MTLWPTFMPIVLALSWWINILLVIVAGLCLYGAYHLHKQYQIRRKKRKRRIRRNNEEWMAKQQAFLDQQRRQH